MRDARRTRREFDLAGRPPLADPAIAAHEYNLPSNVVVVGDQLHWDRMSWHAQRPQEGLLDGFLSLSDASPVQIEEYAGRHGVLGLCQHGFPGPHQATGVATGETSADQSCRRPPHEPLQRWRVFAAQANAVLRIAADLPTTEEAQSQRSERAAFERHKNDWVTLRGGIPSTPRSRYVHGARPSAMVAGTMSQWLAWGGVRPMLSWPGTRPRMELWLGSFFGALALHLAFAVTGSKGIAFCAECGRPYIPTLRIAESDKRDHFCGTCRSLGIPQQRASRRLYARRHGRKKTKEAGR